MNLKKLIPKLPNPKFRMRQGAVKSLLNMELTPMNEAQVELRGLFGKKDKTFTKIKKRPMRTYSLNAVSDETANYFRRLWKKHN
jgi:hypothetical protein